MQFRRHSACKSGERRPQPLATRLSQVPHSLIDDRGDANRGEAQDTFKRIIHGLGRKPFHRTDVEAAQVLMRETISADERQSSEQTRSDAVSQTQSDATRINQTPSDAITHLLEVLLHRVESHALRCTQMQSIRCTQIEKEAQSLRCNHAPPRGTPASSRARTGTMGGHDPRASAARVTTWQG